MTNENYPLLGSKVKFIRVNQETSALSDGVGIVKAIMLDPNNRVQVQVHDGVNAWNIDIVCVNPSDGVKALYADLIKNVQAISEEGNELVRSTVEVYNENVKLAYDAVLGEPVNVDSVPIMPDQSEDEAPQDA